MADGRWRHCGLAGADAGVGRGLPTGPHPGPRPESPHRPSAGALVPVSPGEPPPAPLTRQAEPRPVQVAHGGHRDLPRAGRAGLGTATRLGRQHHLVDGPVVEAAGHAVDLRQLRAEGLGVRGAGLPPGAPARANTPHLHVCAHTCAADGADPARGLAGTTRPKNGSLRRLPQAHPVARLYPLVDEVGERLPGDEATGPRGDEHVPVLQHNPALAYDHRGRSSALEAFKDVVFHVLGRQGAGPGTVTPSPSPLSPRQAARPRRPVLGPPARTGRLGGAGIQKEVATARGAGP